jgi:protein involved in polysaccharide export with SLBB domain
MACGRDIISVREKKSYLFILAAGWVLLPILGGCGAPINVPPLTSDEISRLEAAGNFPHHTYRIEPGDSLQIKYTFHPEMAQDVIVLPDGKIAAQLVGEIMVSGMTTAQLEKLLAERTSDRLRKPEVVVTISRFAEKHIFVGGEVGKPGMVPYRKGLSPLHAIIAAGGFNRETAQADSVILVRTGGPDNNFISRKLNLTEVINDGMKEPIYLAPHDVLYVPSTSVADANLWVKQHITDIFGPLLGVGPRVGMGFRLNQ